MVWNLLKMFFNPSPVDRAFTKCMAASRELGTTAIIFHESMKSIGTDLQPDESALDDLEKILISSQDLDSSLDGVSVFLGCILVEKFGGEWKQLEGGFQIIRLGPRQVSVNLERDLRIPLASHASPRTVYEQICQKVTT